MRLLKEVKILGRTFTVEYFDFDGTLPGNELHGSIKYGKQRISIDSQSDPEMQGATLLHEVIHGLSDSLGLELDEKTVTSFTNGLYQVFKDNELFAIPSNQILNGASTMQCVKPSDDSLVKKGETLT